MLDPIAALVTAIGTAITAQLFVPIMLVAFAIIGVRFIFGNPEHAKAGAVWTLIGGAFVLGAPTIVRGLQAVVH